MSVKEQKRKIFLWFTLCLIVVIGIMGNEIDTTETTEESGYSISKYDVILNVLPNNVIDVTENITVNWNDINHHGIYRFIPEWLEYTDKNDNTIKRKSSVRNLRSSSDPYTVDRVKKKVRIRLGNAYEYVDLGEKTYVIKYTYDMGTDPYKGYDEFIFHAYGDYWNTEIKNASLEIIMPKSLNNPNINFFADKMRQENITEYVNYNIVDNKIYATLNKEKYFQNTNKHLEKSLTVDIELPEGYFTQGNWNYGYGSVFTSLIIFGLTFFSFLIWFKYGKNYPKVPKTVEFYPPENMNSAEIGYIYAKQTSKKLTISLIIQLASKGIIKIDEIKDKKKQIKISKVATSDIKYSSLSILERTVYDKLFRESDETILSENKIIYEAFEYTEINLENKFSDVINDQVSNRKKLNIIIIIIAVIILNTLSYYTIEDMDPSWNILYNLSFLCIFINIIFAMLMKRKTKYGEKITAQVLGFRDFLVTAEKDRLEKLVNENPSYFYDILPYTYVLNVSKKWIDKFENIKMPKIDMGNFEFDSDSSFYDIYDNITFYEDETTHKKTSNFSHFGNNSGSSCGGGCSSCGGGCSSCGGGGSW